jgi:hypothetical protein
MAEFVVYLYCRILPILTWNKEWNKMRLFCLAADMDDYQSGILFWYYL